MHRYWVEVVDQLFPVVDASRGSYCLLSTRYLSYTADTNWTAQVRYVYAVVQFHRVGIRHILDYSSLRSPGYVLGLSSWLHGNMPADNSSPLDLSSRFALTSSTSNPLLCLDSLPHGVIPTLNAGCKVTLEFTAFSPSLRILSAAQIISAIPFFISERSRRRPRPLVSVLKQLSASYGPNLVVDMLSNVSADYEHTLRHVYKSFSGEQKIREMGVRNLGIQAWRQDVFLVALEAALVRRGWIERWAVQVTAK